MHCLIVDTRPSRLDNAMIAFLEAGMQVTGTSSMRVAEVCLRKSLVDVLLIDKGPVGPTHARIVRLAEARNNRLITLMHTPDVAGDTDTLLTAFPSIHCVLGDLVAPNLVVKLALASLAEKTMTADLARPVHAPRMAVKPAPIFQSHRADLASVA